MLADDPRAGEGSHLRDGAALRVLPWELDDHGPLAVRSGCLPLAR
jgi:hypothetical protein